MPRRLRFVPEGGALVEVTCRTFQSRLLLRPSPLLNEIFLGVLARAHRLTKRTVGVCAFSCLGNNYHLVLHTRYAEALSRFMEYFNSNLAREIVRMTGWTDKVWSRRYQAIVISEEEGAQVERLRYVLAHGVKEGLVGRIQEWPGAHCVKPLLGDGRVQGTWFNRTQEYAARQRGEEVDARRFAEEETLILERLPCWAGLTPELYQVRIAEMVKTIEAEAEAVRSQRARELLGAEQILRQDPQTRPNRSKKSPAPFFHAFSKKVRQELYDAYRWFVAAFREAAEKLKGGHRTARFPLGSFPPRLPFVRA
jgi:hypothetical protein